MGDVVGILGNANDNQDDDWMDSTTGETIALKTAYDSCSQCCITDRTDSLFVGPFV